MDYAHTTPSRLFAFIGVILTGVLLLGAVDRGQAAVHSSAYDRAVGSETVSTSVAHDSDEEPFVTVWDTEKDGLSNDDQITIPGEGEDYQIEWEEVDNPDNSGSETGIDEHTITFPEPGTYRVEISGSFTRLNFGLYDDPESGDATKLLDVEQWGDIAWTSMERAFFGAENLDISADDAPDLSAVTSMSGMFHLATGMNSDIGHWDTGNVEDMSSMFQASFAEDHQFNQDIGDWDVNSVTDFSSMFEDAADFNQDIGEWDVSNATNMSNMFNDAVAFNQDIGHWDVSGVTNMRWMFQSAESFNQDISGWDVSSVTNMSGMFWNAHVFNQDISDWQTGGVEDMSNMFANIESFNQDISGWDVGSVTDMSGMFRGNTSFNQDIGGWDVSNVENMATMFRGTEAFNQDIGDWDVSSVTDMSGMFREIGALNQDIGMWDVSSVTSMSRMFKGAEIFNADIGDWDTGSVENMTSMFRWADTFNQDIGDWDTGAVNNMRRMFEGSDSFNQDIGDWDVSNVENMGDMFRYAESFNQDIGDWDTGSVDNMRRMFNEASSFDQDLGGWDVTLQEGGFVSSMQDMLSHSGLSPASYDGTLEGWAEQELQPEVELGAEGIYYCNAGDERQFIIDEFDWSIEDEGQAAGCPEADIEVSAYFLDPDPAEEEIIEGDTLHAEAVVANHSDFADSLLVEFLANGTVQDDTTVTVEGDEVEVVDLFWTTECGDASTYTISVNGLDPQDIDVAQDEGCPDGGFHVEILEDQSVLSAAPGDSILVTTELTNETEEDQTEEITATLEDETDSDTVDLESDASKKVFFVVPVDEDLAKDTYEVVVDGEFDSATAEVVIDDGPEVMEGPLLGDITGDGEVGLSDAVLVQEHVAGVIDLEEQGYDIDMADMNRDRHVTLTDAILLVEKANGVSDGSDLRITEQDEPPLIEAGNNVELTATLTNEGVIGAYQYVTVLVRSDEDTLSANNKLVDFAVENTTNPVDKPYEADVSLIIPSAWLEGGTYEVVLDTQDDSNTWGVTVDDDALVASESSALSEDDDSSSIDFEGTGASMTLSGIEGEGPVEVSRFDSDPAVPDGMDKELEIASERLLIRAGDELAFEEATLRLDVNELGIDDPENTTIQRREEAGVGSFDGLDTSYDEDAGELVVTLDDFSEFVFATEEPVEFDVELTRGFDDPSEQESYRLVGLPGEVDVDVAETVAGAPGTAWRAFREMGAEELLEYDGTEDFHFRPGRGLWLLAQEDWAFEDTVGAVETATDEPAIELNEGWNVISNPLGTDLSWAEVLEANDLDETLWQWTGSWEEADVLRSALEGEAYYFYNEAELDELSLSTEGDEALVAGAAAEAPEEGSDAEPTRLSLDAYAGDNRASGITIGLDPEGGDEVAHRAPPGHFDVASLRIQRPDADDLLARYITPGEEGVFDLVLEAEPETSVELRLMEISEEADARLELLASGASYDLSETSAVTVDMPDGEDRMQLRLHLASAGGALDEMPEELELQAPYPNPARDEVTVAYSLPEATSVVIEVFNVLGQEVALLEDAERPAGVHEITWSLDTGAGDLPSGTYFVRLRADGYTHTEQFIIVR